MNNPMQSTPIRKSWRKGFGPALLMVASLAVLAAVVPTALAAPPASTQKYTFKTVDAPGSDVFMYGIGGIRLTWMNDSGLITQQYIGTDGCYHTAALLRGQWTVIDVPGAANTQGTSPNSQGQVALTYWGNDNVNHLAIWQKGHYTYIPDPCPGYVFGTADSINDLGQVTSVVLDSSGTGLAYVGDARHHRVFAYPGANFTIPMMTNDVGITVGTYWDSNWVVHGFIYDLYDGTHFSIDVPGGSGLWVDAINNEGQIVGSYTDSSGNFVGFELQHGHLTAFNVPGALQTLNLWITDNHKITGTYQSADGGLHGFVATPVGCK